MLAAILPGEFLSWTWWLWAISGVDCLLSFTLLWFYYQSKPAGQQITYTMAIVWATLVTLPGVFFAAGALWWVIDTVRSASL